MPKPKQKAQEVVKPQPKPAAATEKLSLPLLDIPEQIKPDPVKPALLNTPVQSLPQTKKAGDYGEDEFKQEFKAFDNMDAFSPKSKDNSDPLDQKKLEEEITKATGDSIKKDIKDSIKKGTKDSKSTDSFIGQKSTLVKKEAP